MKQKIITPALQNIRITAPLFGRYADVVAEKLLPYQWEVLNDRIPGVEKSYSVENFRVAAGESSGSARARCSATRMPTSGWRLWPIAWPAARESSTSRRRMS